MFTSERVNTVKTYRPTTFHKSQLKLNSTSKKHFAILALRLTSVLKQELSYRKQIARQLRTQLVEGIYRSDYA